MIQIIIITNWISHFYLFIYFYFEKAGGRIKRAVANMLKIFDEYVDQEDGVGFVRFNVISEVVFPLKIKRSDPVNCRFLLETSTKPSKSTAFFNSIRDCIEELKKLPLGMQMAHENASRKRWIISLTDGEDNSSQANCFRARSCSYLFFVIFRIGFIRGAAENASDSRSFADRCWSRLGIGIDSTAASGAVPTN